MTGSLIDDDRTITIEDRENFLREFSIDYSIPRIYHIPPRTLPSIINEEIAHTSRFSRGGFVRYHSKEFVATIKLIEETKLKNALLIPNNFNALFITNTFFNRVLFKNYQLSLGATRMMNLPNAGGSSEISESLSYELFIRLFSNNIRLNRTEMEIVYKNNHGKRTDYSIYVKNKNNNNNINNNNNNDDVIIGVSVTRAMKYRGEFTMEDADCLLQKKLSGVLISNNNVLPCADNYWSKQILHIWCEAHYIADRLRLSYNNLLLLNPELLSNTIIIATVAENAEFIFCNRDDIMNRKQIKKKVMTKEIIKLIEKEKKKYYYPVFNAPIIIMEIIDAKIKKNGGRAWRGDYRGWYDNINNNNNNNNNYDDTNSWSILFSRSPLSSLLLSSLLSSLLLFFDKLYSTYFSNILLFSFFPMAIHRYRSPFSPPFFDHYPLSLSIINQCLRVSDIIILSV